ncbi:DNA polymerase I [Campylobacter helveticus]|uniref:DNA polymerase I n=1 Tax=Campylobacter helveticus TaxID=28898 RepID=A0AAX2UK01_9BACT|nr:DNA polymerase I [Campylobacter helveticus]ARE80030.1 DNA polymerase I, 5' --> 3' polymerase, 5' --> 3' and 3' --> 5' exonuclease [Campylobacter helveticus]MCR2054441.1 DNA polymerase I [Campylobacter helveticus]TNB55073.1 DNA polymerase I [Campylobacter helveticus]TNB58209.1 DNA polymerase I [Campylobacter helveticus]TNB58485.1 DNA polymerase I [Campylobacter helveticus]
MKTLTIIDTFGFFFRLYYALKNFTSSKGEPSGMVSGFANFIYSLKNEYKSDYIIFALDSKGKTFRSEIDPNYKTNRTPPPPELLAQIPICIEMIEKMGFVSISRENYEADDIIASVVKSCKDKDIFVRIITQDKDLYQLIKDEKVSIYSPISKNDYDEAACLEKYGVKPSQIKDFLALCGDSADNIPGVKGIGAKGAKTLLDEFGSIEAIYENLSLVRNERSKKLLLEGKENAFLSKKLASLYEDLELKDLIEKSVYTQEEPLLKVIEYLERFELNSLLKKLKLNPQNQNKNLGFKATLIVDENILFEKLENLESESIIAFDTETTGLDVKEAKIVGFSFCLNENEAFYVPLTHNYLGVGVQISMQAAKKALEKIYSHFIVGHNLKYDFAIVENNFSLPPPKKYADTMILAWLYNPSLRVNMDDLALRLFSYETLHFESVVKKGENFAGVELEKACKYAAEDAYITLRFYLYFLKNLEPDLLKLAFKSEFDFIEVLRKMEQNGIKLDTQKLRELMQNFENEIKLLSEEIYTLCDDKFNLNSPKQVGDILFIKLGLPSSKKGKTGFSTDEKVLESLIDKHPAVSKILSYRELAKLYSTYCEPLLKLALKDSNSRIHSSFLQTGTATGRLSSKEPNLQNIPAHGQYAKKYKSCFVAEEGFSFISLDYSQIELRMLAHFSEDAKLLEAFKNDEDIHARTAIMIFGENNYETRSIAKSINFGLIYGMGYKTLSQNLKIEASLAKTYIEKYFNNFTSIKSFFEKVKNEARQNHFIKTLSGRKRYFDFENAKPMQIAMYERESINSILQGSAADIIKLAMLKLCKDLNEDKRLILQIHDELIFEVKDELCENFEKRARDIMENIVELKVNLKTSSSIAKNWGALKS